MSGSVIYNGVSRLDRTTPIIAVALASRSRNRKTGPMVQTYIIRPDMDPIEASRTGADDAICGECRHRGQATDKATGIARARSCYVNLGQGPLQVYRSFRAGNYTDLAGTRDARIADIGAGRAVRLGTYGDPAAVPVGLWERLVSRATGHTGYTHNAHYLPACDRRRLQKLCMYSADSKDEAIAARARGWRTFRVSQDVNRTVDETLCPASEQAGHKTTCQKCRLCSGSESAGRSIYIPAHGSGKIHFIRSV